MKIIDLSDYPVVDDHCHPFLPSMEPKLFAQNFNWSSIFPPVPVEQTEDLILYRRTISELARFLGLSKTNSQEIVAMRNEKYRREPKEYISRLFQDASIDCLIFETGYPSEEKVQAGFVSHAVDPAELQRLLPCNFKRIFRLERLIDLLFQDAHLGFDDMLNKYDDSLQGAITHEGYIGFKSIIAYGYGLDIQDRLVQDARDTYNELKEKGRLALPLKEKEETVLRKEKVLRDFLIFRGIEKSAQLNVPFHIHTGFGTSPIISIARCNPLLLCDALKNDKLRKARIVLLHAGYPYVEEVGYLANQFPNVYVDMSVVIPFAYPAIKSKVVELLEMTPTTKLLYGSDGYNIPELFWISAILGKEALSAVLGEMVTLGTLDEDYAYKVASRVLHENAEQLYRALHT